MNKKSEARSQNPGISSQQQYDDIAFIYDLLAEGDDGMIYFRMHVKKILDQLPEKAKVLDCSCGTGDHAIWLARQGFEVHASDISEGMIREGKEKAVLEDIEITFFQSSWEELPEKMDGSYDLIVCPGNSLSHIDGLNKLGPTFKAIRKMLKKDGTFFFDIRNWERTFEEASLETQEFKVKKKKETIEARYSYDIKGWNTPCQMNVDVRPEGKTTYKRYPFQFFPIGFQQIHDALSAAGFEHIERDFYPGEEYYFACAK